MIRDVSQILAAVAAILLTTAIFQQAVSIPTQPAVGAHYPLA